MLGIASHPQFQGNKVQGTTPQLRVKRLKVPPCALYPVPVGGPGAWCVNRQMARFEDLEVWKRSARLSADLYEGTSHLKDFAYRDQVTRAGLSISSNIAEGYERGSTKETASFLNYAKGSAGELRSQIYVGMDIGYVDDATGLHWLCESIEISRMLHNLIRAVRRRF
jgi:four helix bundle protein